MYKVIIIDSIEDKEHLEYHSLTLKQAIRLSIKMIEDGFESFVKQDDDIWL